MPISVRTRFDIFKRDSFTCQYCGQKSPDVVLEVDHIVPVCEDGTDDPINLQTACWECNSGKSGVPLSHVMTGEDPHDRAIFLLEKERQLREYNHVLAEESARRTAVAESILNWWCEEAGVTNIRRDHFTWLKTELKRTCEETIRNAMEIAISRRMTKDWRYVMVVLRNWRDDEQFAAVRRA